MSEIEMVLAVGFALMSVISAVQAGILRAVMTERDEWKSLAEKR